MSAPSLLANPEPPPPVLSLLRGPPKPAAGPRGPSALPPRARTAPPRAPVAPRPRASVPAGRELQTGRSPIQSPAPLVSHRSGRRPPESLPPATVQKSCELGVRFVELEKKHIQLNLDLELAKTNLQKAKDEATGKMNQALAKKDQDLAAA
nr:swi5-dependent recombination DNA repair protein 1 homolog [Aegilops tauschii subsp. strangulata]